MPLIKVEPGKEYVGFPCAKCGVPFPVAGPIEASANEDLTVRLSDPFEATCPYCGHAAAYPKAQLRRLLGSHKH